MFAKALRFGVLAQKGPGLITRHRRTSPRDPSERVTVALVTGCGCLALTLGIVALLAIFVRGSFDAGEPIDTAVALFALAVLAIEWWKRERSTHQLVRARRA